MKRTLFSVGGVRPKDCQFDQVFAGQGKPFEFILDFYHAIEHLHDFMKTWRPHDEERRKPKAAPAQSSKT